MTFAAGSSARLELTKWGGRPHWHYDMVLLGTDPYGRWFGGPSGTVLQRGAEPPISWPCDFVLLVPWQGNWLATFNASGPTELYVDITGPIVLDGRTVRADDLDLDVARRNSGEVRLLDEDEFELHRRTFGYPDDVVADARATAQRVLRQVIEGAEPFGHRGRRWLAKLAAQRPA